MRGRVVGVAGSITLAALTPSPLSQVFVGVAVGLYVWAIWTDNEWSRRTRHFVSAAVIIAGVIATLWLPTIARREREELLDAIAGKVVAAWRQVLKEDDPEKQQQQRLTLLRKRGQAL